MRLVKMSLVLFVFLSFKAYGQKVWFEGQWDDAKEPVKLSYFQDAVIPKIVPLKTPVDVASHSFSLELDVKHPTLLQFYEHDIVILPGDTVRSKVSGNEPNVNVSFNGKLAMEHNFLVRLNKAMGIFEPGKFRIDDRSIEKYKVAATHHYDSSLLFLTNDAKKFKFRPSFKAMAQGYLTTIYYSHLLYPVVANLIPREKLPKYYFELVDFSFFKSPDFLGFRNFIVTASQYNEHYYTNTFADAPYDSLTVSAKIRSANHNFFGEVKDNLLLYIFSGLIENGSDINAAQVTMLYEYLTGVFNLDPARLKQLQTLKHEFDILDKPLPIKVLEQELTTSKGKVVTLAQILATNEVIYMGFWASTCNTCISEMTAQKQLVDDLQGKGIKFILISFDEDIKRWQKSISKMKIKADHYLIKEGFASTITHYISFNDIPRYLLFDNGGKLVDLNARIPSALLKDKSLLPTLMKKSSQ